MSQIPEDLKKRYDDILLEAADNGGEYLCDEDAETVKLIERIASLTEQIAELRAVNERLVQDVRRHTAQNERLMEENKALQAQIYHD